MNDLPVREYLSYGRLCVEDYQYVINDLIGELPAQSKILEIGTGKSVAVPCLLAAEGHDVISLDRFNNVGDIPSAMIEVCSALKLHYEQVSEFTFNVSGSRVEFVHEPVESYMPRLEACFDLVVSRATLEHFSNLAAGVNRLAEYTVPGGLHVHEIDHRDHGIFSHSKLVSNMWFHSISAAVWTPLLNYFPGLPNKQNATQCRLIFEAAGIRTARHYLRQYPSNYEFTPLDKQPDADHDSPVTIYIGRRLCSGSA